MAPNGRTNNDSLKEDVDRLERGMSETRKDHREDMEDVRGEIHKSVDDLWIEVNKLRDRVHDIERWQSLCYGVVGVGSLLAGYLIERILK